MSNNKGFTNCESSNLNGYWRDGYDGKENAFDVSVQRTEGALPSLYNGYKQSYNYYVLVKRVCDGKRVRVSMSAFRDAIGCFYATNMRFIASDKFVSWLHSGKGIGAGSSKKSTASLNSVSKVPDADKVFKKTFEVVNEKPSVKMKLKLDLDGTYYAEELIDFLGGIRDQIEEMIEDVSSEANL